MKILITGAGGMLGTDLSKALSPFFNVTGIGWHPAPHLKIPFTEVDLSKTEPAQKIVAAQTPDLIFHTAAMTDVDACERNRELALKGNLGITKNVVDAANRADAFLIFFSTDYVFDGQKNDEYREEDLPKPINIYGESKYQAEIYMQKNAKKYVIIRVSWLYGLHGKSFPRTILERAPRQKKIEVVNDQIGRPTYTRDVAEALAGVLKMDSQSFGKWNREIFNFGNKGKVSWAEFAGYILSQAGFQETEIVPISSAQLNRPAKRPQNSILSLEKAQTRLGLHFRSWQDGFLDFLREFRSQ